MAERYMGDRMWRRILQVCVLRTPNVEQGIKNLKSLYGNILILWKLLQKKNNFRKAIDN